VGGLLRGLLRPVVQAPRVIRVILLQVLNLCAALFASAHEQSPGDSLRRFAILYRYAPQQPPPPTTLLWRR
jgi:hypothetical protein